MTDAPAEGPPFPVLLARGVARALAQRGYATLTEVSLANGRRADVMGLGRGGELVIVEVKSSLQDFRSDAKWREYREFCDRFYFAVSACGTVAVSPTLPAAKRRPPTLNTAAAKNVHSVGARR